MRSRVILLTTGCALAATVLGLWNGFSQAVAVGLGLMFALLAWLWLSD